MDDLKLYIIEEIEEPHLEQVLEKHHDELEMDVGTHEQPHPFPRVRARRGGAEVGIRERGGEIVCSRKTTPTMCRRSTTSMEDTLSEILTVGSRPCWVGRVGSPS